MPSSKSESMEMTQSEHTKERLAGIKLPKMNAVFLQKTRVISLYLDMYLDTQCLPLNVIFDTPRED